MKNLTVMQKKMIKYIAVVVVLLILLFVVLFIIKAFRGETLSYEKIENKMLSAAKSYYETNPHLLPDEDIGYKSIDVKTLSEDGYMKNLNKYTKKGVSCNGKVIVLKNGSYISYVPKLNCGKDYTTENLVDTLTSPANIVTTGDGLYQIGTSYVYRGEKLNNYVSFANKIWRIIEINADSEIRMIQNDAYDTVDWDDRYNAEKLTYSGINNFSVSRIKDDLEKIYNGEDFDADAKAKIVPKRLCVGKRNITDTSKDGSTECSVLTEDYFPLGLIQVNEVLRASLDSGCKTASSRECGNYNFLTNYSHNFWSITTSSANTYDAYRIDSLPVVSQARNYGNIKLVINISSQLNYTKGNGTIENPYIID